MPFLLAAGNIPIIVLGSRETASARFVERFQIGTVVGYDGQGLRGTVEKICSPTTQGAIRETAAKLAPAFSAQGVGRWILDSIKLGHPVSEAMETLMPRRTATGGSIIFLETPAPADVFRDFVPLYHALDRVRRNGFQPDFICDVGASTGIWSRTVRKIFPGARFLLFEPLFPVYSKKYSYLEEIAAPGEVLPVALGAFSGEIMFSVSPDLYGSSLLSPPCGYGCRSLKVPIATLDSVGEERKVVGRGILKLDVQGAEHLVLAGAKRMLEQIDVLVVELSLSQLSEGAKGFEEMYRLIVSLGFEYFDDVGEWRCPVSGRLLQKDVLFIRQNLFHQG
jgi:FkbM family methyltransferase